MNTLPLFRRTVAGIAAIGATAAVVVTGATAASAAPPRAVPATQDTAPAPAPGAQPPSAQPGGAQSGGAEAGGAQAGGAGLPTPPDPAAATNIAEWVSGGGQRHLKLLGHDFEALAEASSAANMTRMGASCAQLKLDVEGAQAFAPIPDSNAQRHWAAALKAYAHGAADCVTGARASSTASTTLILRSADEIVAGSNSLNKVTARLNQISGIGI